MEDDIPYLREKPGRKNLDHYWHYSQPVKRKHTNKNAFSYCITKGI
jgi:hypothetical protein